MSSTAPLIAGFVLALAIAAPIGPTAMLLIHRTLAHGTSIGIASGAGVAAAHALYALFGAFGLTACSAVGNGCTSALRVAAALALAWLAWRMVTSSLRADEAPRVEPIPRALGAATSAIAFVLVNPMTALLYVAASVSLSSLEAQHPFDQAIFVLGVYVGSLAWWCALTVVVGQLRARIGPRQRRILNVACAGGFAVFAAWSLRALLA